MARYLLLLSSGWFSFEDAGIHGLDILHHQPKKLVAETKHKLKDGGKADQNSRGRAKNQSQTYLENTNLLGDREGLVVELLDKLGGHLVGVVGGRVGTLLLQEVNFDCHGANALFGLVKVVVGH